MREIDKYFVSMQDSICDAMQRIDRGAKGIVLAVDKHHRLLDTISDGDIRRAILAGLTLESSIEELMQIKQATVAKAPTTAHVDTSPATRREVMRKSSVRQLPLLDSAGRVVGLEMLEDKLADDPLPVQAVIMAGGFGTRLRPLTDDTPKPMLPIGGRPLLERMIGQLRTSGIREINLTTHYLPEKITQHFGCGDEHGVRINYVAEDQPLGTAGSLRLVNETDDPLLVLNGDILTRTDFRALINFHREHQADLTIGVRQYSLEIPYGVIETKGGYVSHLREKPRVGFIVNAGIYLLEPSVRSRIPAGGRYDMTDLIEDLLKNNRPVASFPVVEYWLDIGQHHDLAQAQNDISEMRWAS